MSCSTKRGAFHRDRRRHRKGRRGKGFADYIFGGKDQLVAAYLRGRLDAWRERVSAAQAGIDDPEEKILAVFDAIADDVSRPDFRGCPFVNAAAEVPAGEAQELAIAEYRRWVRESFQALAADTGVADMESLADALIVLFFGALATAEISSTARTAAMTAKLIARPASHCESLQPRPDWRPRKGIQRHHIYGVRHLPSRQSSHRAVAAFRGLEGAALEGGEDAQWIQ